MDYEVICFKNEHGWDELRLKLKLTELSKTSIGQAAQFLIQNIADIVRDNAQISLELNLELKFIVNNELEIHEPRFWGLLCDAQDDYISLTSDYAKSLLELCKQENDALFYSDSEHFVGSYALIASLDKIYEQKADTDSKSVQAFRTFYQCLLQEDMEFETFEDMYIEKILLSLYRLDRQLMIELLCFRLSQGQCTNKSFYYLHPLLTAYSQGSAVLKPLFDHIIKHKHLYPSEFVYAKSTYLCLLAVLYGESHKAIEDVINQVKKQLGAELLDLDDNERKRLISIQQAAEMLLTENDDTTLTLCSGYHTYDVRKGTWQ